MKKILLSLASLALASGGALAADLPAPVYKAAPPPPPSYSWSGCYIDGGAGYGMWNQDNNTETFPGVVPTSTTQTTGGRGWYGQVGAGCDYQVSSQFLIGAFGDYSFMNLRGQFEDFVTGINSTEKESGAWAAGARIGYIALPGLLTYLNGGWTGTRFDQMNLNTFPFGAAATGLSIPATNYNGWFIGGGTETSLAGFFGLNLPAGLFLRSEYRYSSYGARDLPIVVTATGALTGSGEHATKYVQTIGTSLVWKFNFGGPVSTRY
jgi:outer membrane immunogenic protein